MNKIKKKLLFTYRYLTAHKREKPDFLIIGAQKSGTTSLHYYLSQHPQLFMPPTKELHFFDVKYYKGVRHYLKYFLLKKDIQQKRKNKRVFLQGESSPFYIMHPWVPKRAFKYNPSFKIIAILRDPIERAVSHYKHNKSRGREKLSFSAAIQQEQSRTSLQKKRLFLNPKAGFYKYRNYSYLERGLYESQLERWRKYFQEDKILILQFEELVHHPEIALNKIYDFLELDRIPIERLDLEKKNSGKIGKVPISPEDMAFMKQYYLNKH